MGAEPFGDLNCEGADPSGAARDEDLLSWSDTQFIPQCLQSGQTGQWHRRSSREIEIGRHQRGVSLVDAGLLCESAATILGNAGEHTLTHAEASDVAADGDDFAGKFVAQHERKLWPVDDAKLALAELEIDRVQSRSAYVHEDIAWSRNGSGNVGQPRTVSATIAVEDVGAHYRRSYSSGPIAQGNAS